MHQDTEIFELGIRCFVCFLEPRVFRCGSFVLNTDVEAPCASSVFSSPVSWRVCWDASSILDVARGGTEGCRVDVILEARIDNQGIAIDIR